MVEGKNRKRPKVLPFRERERDTRQNVWKRVCRGVGSERERKPYPQSRGSGGWTQMALGTPEECLQQKKMVGEQQG